MKTELRNRFLLLSNYNTKKTFSENLETIIGDLLIEGQAQTAVESLLGVLGLAAKDGQTLFSKIAAGSKGLSKYKSLDEFKTALKNVKGEKEYAKILTDITTGLKGSARASFKEAIMATKFGENMKSAINVVDNNPEVLKSMFKYYETLGLTPIEIAEMTAKATGREVKEINSLINKSITSSSKSQAVVNKPKPKQTTGGGTKDLTPTKPKPRFNINLKEKLKEYLKKFPKANWKQIVKWGAGLGITAAVLWYLFHDNDDIPVPTDIPPTDENLGGGGGGTNDGGTSGGGAGWTDAPSCEDVQNGNATMSKGMMGDCVGTIQTKLNEVDTAGLKVDNKFGKRTKKAVENFQTKNGLTATGEVDKETYDKLFGGATTGSDYEESPDTTAGADEDF